MVPVEPVSLSIGIAALFTNCIECFEYFKAATNLRKDFDLLLLKLASLVDDIPRLRLISEACEDIYPEWSDTARSAIDASETGTIDGLLANDRIEQYQAVNDENALSNTRGTHDLPTWFGDDKVGLNTFLDIFFVLTEQCRNEGTDSPCVQTDLGGMSFTDKHCFIPSRTSYTGSSPGYWIAEHIKPQNFTFIDLEKFVENHVALQAHAIAELRDLPTENQFSVKLYVYCPPCACQVATALNICESVNKSRHLDTRIRVDYRQSTSCSMSSSRIDGLVSLIDYIKTEESKSQNSENADKRLKAIDRQWLEQIVYDYEEEVQMTTPSPANQLCHIVRPHQYESLCATIIILGEADYCIPLMEAPPFPPSKPGRTPQETQLYRMFQTYDSVALKSPWFWRRHYMGTYSRKEPLKKKRPAPVMLDTGTEGYESEPRSKRSSTSQPNQVGSQN